ncbi:MAG: flavodoxin [Bacteroidales bacterium]|nr:flavodoxin [Bacteroidales bacterium]
MKTGIFYSFSSGKTQGVGERIVKEFGDNIEINDIEEIDGSKFLDYDLIIIGVSTWFDGGLPDYWEDFLPEFDKADLSNKKVAIFGLGNQQGYPENFGDAISVIAEVLEPHGCRLLGFTSTDGYDFEESKSIREGKFMGLVIDEETQPELTVDRITNWVTQIKKEYNS